MYILEIKDLDTQELIFEYKSIFFYMAIRKIMEHKNNNHSLSKLNWNCSKNDDTMHAKDDYYLYTITASKVRLKIYLAGAISGLLVGTLIYLLLNYIERPTVLMDFESQECVKVYSTSDHNCSNLPSKYKVKWKENSSLYNPFNYVSNLR